MASTSTAGFPQAAAGLAEALSALGRHGAGAHEVRRPDAVGARVPWAADNHWIDAAVVPVGATPPADDAALPHCLWIASGGRAEGRTELPDIAMPVMALDLADLPEAGAAAEAVPIGEIGAVNDRAYGGEQLGPLIGALPPAFGRAYAVRDPGGGLASVAAAATSAPTCRSSGSRPIPRIAAEGSARRSCARCSTTHAAAACGRPRCRRAPTDFRSTSASGSRRSGICTPTCADRGRPSRGRGRRPRQSSVTALHAVR